MEILVTKLFKPLKNLYSLEVSKIQEALPGGRGVCALWFEVFLGVLLNLQRWLSH